MKGKLSILWLVVIVNSVVAQELTQVVKGKVVDADTRAPLFGANILILGTDPPQGAISDENGNFTVDHVKVGRCDIRISYMGYETIILNEIMVSSGKEVYLNASMKESVLKLAEVEIRAKTRKDQPLNSMATLSARQLSVEEASRYAGSFDDPSRLASSFAGVAQQLGHNGIVIRGNAPKGLLWRMEGIQISNPTHFANYVAFGAGGITALSSMMLANSDFFTGAFPAEYGNALSGVFDIKMRSGNPDHREYTLQAGLVGLDVSAEGPFVKEKSSTYLFNYRYSTLALLGPILPEEAGIIEYQDLAFKLDFPMKKAGTLSFWGLGALDYQGRDAKGDPDEWETSADREKLRANLFMGVLGLNHKVSINKNTFLNSSLAVAGNGLDWSQSRLSDSLVFVTGEDVKNITWDYTLSSTLNHKFSSRHRNKTGVNIRMLNYDIHIQHAESYEDPLLEVAKDQGHGYLFQVFTQSGFDLGTNWSLNLGLQSQYFALNGHHTIEPRAGIRWNFKPGQSLALGYGLHSQMELITFYLTKIDHQGLILHPNKDLDFSKAHHIVLSYDLMINENIRLKIEPFYQKLYHIPVKPSSSYSLQNIEKEWIISDTLLNNGEGVNFGLDITFERFLNRGFYYLLTASLFDSRYRGGDGIWRDSRYNKNYVFNILAGKEWNMGKKKNNLLSVNAKLTLQGGDRYDPLLFDESMDAGEIIYDDTRAFEEQKPHAQVLSFSISYIINKKGRTSTWSFSMLNALGQEEFNGYRYNDVTGQIEKEEDVLMIPNISYKLEF